MNGNPERDADDRALSALIDGELPPDAARRLTARLAREPELANRHRAMLCADREVHNALTAGDDDPLPPSVLGLLHAASGAAPSPGNMPHSDPRVVRRRRRTRRRLPARRLFELPAAIAASFALVVGFLFAQLLPPALDTGGVPSALPGLGPVASGSALDRVLSETASSERFELGAGIAATPRYSFRQVDGTHCRLLDVLHAPQMTRAVACRQDGAWQIEMAALADAAIEPQTGLYQPADGGLLPLDRALGAMIDGDPLGREEELERMREGWRD